MESTMHIKADAPVARLSDERVLELNDGDPVDFSVDRDGGTATARVRKDVGEYLADSHEGVTITDREGASTDGDDGGDDE